MWPRLSILVGLLAGIATAVLVLGGILAFAPEPTPAVTPAPQPSLASPSPTATVASPSPTASVAQPSPTASVAPPSATASVAPPSAGSGAPSAGTSANPSGDITGLFGIGQPAPALVVPQVGGGTIDLAALRGKPVWVNFMGTYCPPCVDEFPLMNGFATRYADDGLVILAIDVREDEGTVEAFASGLNATFPIGLDGDGTVAEGWRATAALPSHFWVDKDGIVRDGAAGGVGPDIMARGVQSIMPDVIVTP